MLHIRITLVCYVHLLHVSVSVLLPVPARMFHHLEAILRECQEERYSPHCILGVDKDLVFWVTETPLLCAPAMPAHDYSV